MLFFCLFLFMFSVHSQTVRLCMNCKHFLLNPSLSGKCTLFPEKMEDNMNYLITNYKKCIIVRYTSDRCGEKGKYYESRIF